MRSSILSEFERFISIIFQTSIKTKKKQLIRDMLTHPVYNEEFRKLLEFALSPYYTFGIARVPSPDPNIKELYDDPRKAYDETIDLLTLLSRRYLTGYAAQDAVSKHLGRLWFDERKAFRRILLKDLRAGFTATTVNSIFPHTIPVFSCQLALSEMPCLSEIKYPVFVEPKYDGVRTIAYIVDGRVTLFSRNGKIFENFEEIEKVLPRYVQNAVLDGEVISPSGFAALMTRAKAKRGAATDVPIQYRIFDAIPPVEWDQQRCTLPLNQRKSWLAARLQVDAGNKDGLIAMTPYYLANDASAVESIYRDFVEAGLEGAMIKDPEGFYTYKRNKTWMKLKPFKTVDLQVTEVIEGTGKYAGVMGALFCCGEHKGHPLFSEVGSGFTDEQRATIWNNRKEVIGRTVEIRYQEISKALGSETYSLRFPTFVRFRDDK